MKKVFPIILVLCLTLSLLIFTQEKTERQQPVERRGIRINHLIMGEGIPIIMLHDFGLDHHQLIGCMEPLFKDKLGWKRVYIDLPGMGNSESKEWVNNSDKVLEIISSLIENTFPKQSIVLVGHSYGAYLARAIAQEKGQLVEGILMIAPITIPSDENRKLPKRTVIFSDPKLLSELKAEEIKLFESQVVIQNEKTWQRYRDDILPGINVANHEFLMRLRGLGFAFSFDLDKVRVSFEKPVLILTGKQDHIVGFQDALKLLDSYPRADFIIMDSAGHHLQFEQEELFNNCVTHWLNRIEQGLPKDIFKIDKENNDAIDISTQK